MSSKLAKKFNLQLTVTNGAGAQITFLNEQVETYVQLKKELHSSLLSIAKSLNIVKAQELYLMENYATFKDFVQDCFDVSTLQLFFGEALICNHPCIRVRGSHDPGTAAEAWAQVFLV